MSVSISSGVSSGTLVFPTYTGVSAAIVAGSAPFQNVVLVTNFTSNYNDAKGKVATTSGMSLSGGQAIFNGSGWFTYADSTDFAFGSGDFTIETFVTLGAGTKAADNYYALLQQNSGTTTTNSALYCYFESRTAGSNKAWTCKWFNSSGTPLVSLEEIANSVNDYTEGQEYHICVERFGSTFTLYRNGVVRATATYSGALDDANGALQLGHDSPGGSFFLGSMNSIRITKGFAVYKGPFTPPSNIFPES